MWDRTRTSLDSTRAKHGTDRTRQDGQKRKGMERNGEERTGPDGTDRTRPPGQASTRHRIKGQQHTHNQKSTVTSTLHLETAHAQVHQNRRANGPAKHTLAPTPRYCCLKLKKRPTAGPISCHVIFMSSFLSCGILRTSNPSRAVNDEITT